jgi:hypothetical protein
MRVSPTRIAGILISITGVVFLLIFLRTTVNPDVTIGNLGLLALLLGVLVVAFDLFTKKIQLQGVNTIVAVTGWSLFSAGLLVGLAGFLLANQVACSCPEYPLANYPCICGVPLYNLMFSGGILTAVAGAAVVIVTRLHPLSVTRQLTARTNTRRLHRAEFSMR